MLTPKQSKPHNITDDMVITATNYMQSDREFDELYPEQIRRIGLRHWTPIHIAKLAIAFLADENAKILDIGSGVGKFCLAAGYYAPHVDIVGVEQRRYLINHGIRAQQQLGLDNVSFIHKNFTQINFHDYTHFYFFNSFFENINDIDRIDETIDYSEALYDYYVRYLYKALQEMPKGTKVAAYHTLDYEIPGSYRLVEKHAEDRLKFWIKG